MTAGPFLRVFLEAQVNLLNREFRGGKPTITPEIPSGYRGVDESVGTVPKPAESLLSTPFSPRNSHEYSLFSALPSYGFCHHVYKWRVSLIIQHRGGEIARDS